MGMEAIKLFGDGTVEKNVGDLGVRVVEELEIAHHHRLRVDIGIKTALTLTRGALAGIPDGVAGSSSPTAMRSPPSATCWLICLFRAIHSVSYLSATAEISVRRGGGQYHRG